MSKNNKREEFLKEIKVDRSKHLKSSKDVKKEVKEKLGLKDKDIIGATYHDYNPMFDEGR